jgi:hypothetical protein
MYLLKSAKSFLKIKMLYRNYLLQIFENQKKYIEIITIKTDESLFFSDGREVNHVPGPPEYDFGCMTGCSPM